MNKLVLNRQACLKHVCQFSRIIFLAALILPLANIKSATAQTVPGVGEVNTANTNGLRIIVTVTAPLFVGYTRTQINGENGALLNYGSNMIGGTTTIPFLFYPNLIKAGEKFVISSYRRSVQMLQVQYDNRDNLERLQFIVWDAAKLQWED